MKYIAHMELFWEQPGWEETDAHLAALRRSPFQRPIPFIPQHNGLYIIRGPRQVGKSSWLKLILQHYASLSEWHQRCMYLSCDTIRDFKELSELLNSVRDRKLIILDEITFVSDWDRAVKHLVDSAPDHILIVSGSNAADLRRGADRMPGRFGGGGEFSLLPMDFCEFGLMRAQFGQSLSSRVEELAAFFTIGGFPAAVAHGAKEPTSLFNVRQDFKRWLIGDARRLGKQESYLREVMGVLAITMGSPISLQKLAQRTQLGSHHTALEYVQLLEDCYALRTLYAMDPNDYSLRFRKEKKFYFTDPGIFWTALEWYGLAHTDDDMGRLAECVAHEQLARRGSRIGYLTGPKGEIDFFIPPKEAIEVKWSPIVRNLSRAYLDFNSLEKKVWYQGNFLE